MPSAVLEAAAIGLPIIATNHGGIPEIAGENGFEIDKAELEAYFSEIAADHTQLSDFELELVSGGTASQPPSVRTCPDDDGT